MARPAVHLVRLKLRLLRAGVQGAGVQGQAGFIVACVLAAAFGLFAGVGFAATRGVDRALAGDIALLVFGLLFVAWALVPVIMVVSENTLEVDRLAVYPLGPRELMPGLLVASMAGFGGLFTALCLVGGMVGLVPVSGLALVSVTAFAVQLAICVAGSRVVSTWLAAAVRKRRWRDLALTIAPAIGLLISLGGQFLGAAGDRDFDPPDGPYPDYGQPPFAPVDDEPDRLPSGLTAALRLLPSGPPGAAVRAAAEGRSVDALVALAVSVAVLVGLLWLWWKAIVRVLTTAAESGRAHDPSASGGRRGGAGAGRRAALFPRPLRWLPSNRVGAVAAKELRQLLRDPRQRSGLFVGVFVVVMPLFTARASGLPADAVVLWAAMPALVYGGTAINMYAYDGPRFWMHLSAGDDARSDLLGKNLAIGLTTGVMCLVAAVALAALSGSWALVVPTLGLAFAVAGFEIGVGNVTSVTNPVPMPDSATNPFGNNTGQGIQMIGPVLLSMLAVSALAVPLVVATVLVGDTLVGGAAVVAVEVAVGVLAWRLGFTRGVRRSQYAQVDLLTKLDARRPL